MRCDKKRAVARLMQSKRAMAVDLDWIISLGIFLIYLGIFFIAIRQLPNQQSPASALLEGVFTGVVDASTWQVQKLPLFMASNISGTEPFIINFPYSWKNFTFQDNTSFEIKDGKLLFAKKIIQGKNILWLASSGENYPQPGQDFDLEASPSGASIDSQRLVTEFSSAFLARANHFTKERLDEFNISISEIPLKPENALPEANISAMSAKYKLIYPQLNHTSFIIAGYSRISSFVSTDSREPHDITLSATIRNYTSFYMDNSALGTINYSTRECSNALGRYIDFYDGVSGLTFIVPEGSNISFCARENTARLGIQFAMANETRYDMIFHEGDFNATLKYVSPYKAEFGIAENITGISKSLYRKVNETKYETLKVQFNYPTSRDFSFTLSNESGTNIFTYRPKIPGITNVFAKEGDVFILDSYGIKARHRLRVNGW